MRIKGPGDNLIAPGQQLQGEARLGCDSHCELPLRYPFRYKAYRSRSEKEKVPGRSAPGP